VALVASLIAAIIGAPICTAASAHDGWFVRVCPGKTEANRIHMSFSGDRQGFSWSWIKGRTPDETDLPRRFRSVARVTMRGSTASTPSNIQPHAYVCVGFRYHIVQRLEFDDHEDHQKNWNDVPGDDELGTIKKLGFRQKGPGKIGTIEYSFE
jgi:hypothetical protein